MQADPGKPPGIRLVADQDAEDRALVAQSRAGDAVAFERLVERYQRILFTVALRMLGEYDAASDAAQTAFVKAYQKLDTFDPSRRFFSWIYRILINECLNARRDIRTYEEIPRDLIAAGTPADTFEIAERRNRVQAAILVLPIEYREVVVLRYFAELSYDEISDVLHVPAKTVKSRLHTAKARLATLLNVTDARA